MKIVFFGSSDFSIESLRVLIDNHEVVAVYTQPDRKKGRKLMLSMTPVKIAAQENNIPVFQPERVSDDDVIEQLWSFNADLFVVVSFGQKLSNAVLDIPKHFCVNVHSSLLPRWRGASPINQAIVNGDKYSGVTIMKMNEHMDAGDMILSRSIEIGDDDSIVLCKKLAKLGGETLAEAIGQIEHTQAEFITQDEAGVTVARKLKKENGLIHWADDAAVIHNKVRGLLPWPCAFTHYKQKLLKILKTKVVDPQHLEQCQRVVGTVIEIKKHEGIVIATGHCTALLVEILQHEGKKAMNAYDFVIGHKVQVGDTLQ